jgi:hypothetical protein
VLQPFCFLLDFLRIVGYNQNMKHTGLGFLLVLLPLVLTLSCETTEPLKLPPEEPPVPEAAPPPVTEALAEYSRSVAALGVSISEETFHEDKEAIMKAIDDLERIMARKDTAQWRKYLSPTSIAYLRNANSMRAVSAKLPSPIQIRSDEDYFKYVFIPSREGRKVDEIRYVSSTEAKAVQLRENNDVIYYYFEKVNGVWLVKLDESQS